jgi:hypothetical protein
LGGLSKNMIDYILTVIRLLYGSNPWLYCHKLLTRACVLGLEEVALWLLYWLNSLVNSTVMLVEAATRVLRLSLESLVIGVAAIV